MAEVDRPGKLYVGGLNTDTSEKTLEAVFSKYGKLEEVLLMKTFESKKSRGFAFVTFESPTDAKNAARDMNGKSLDGKAIKVEQATKPAFETGSNRRAVQSSSRSRGASRGLRRGRGGLEVRGPPTRGLPTRGPPPMKRGLSVRSGGPPPKRPFSEPMRYGGIREPPSREWDDYGASRRDSILSQREDYSTPEDYHYSIRDSYSSRDYPSYSEPRDYSPPQRDYSYDEYGQPYSQDEYEYGSRGYSDRDGYAVEHDSRDYLESDYLDSRDYLESDYLEDRSTRVSYRESYETYGNSRSAPPARGPPPSYGGSSRFDDYSSSRDEYDGSRDHYPSSRSDPYSTDHGDRFAREDRGPVPPMDRGYAPRDSYSSSGRGAPRGRSRGGSRIDRGGGRGRY